MAEAEINTPVALILFNRPTLTARVFEQVRAARPPILLVIADGPRADRDGEAEKCRAARAVVDSVDWDCDVRTHFSDTNLGCRRRVSSGLSWVFDQVREAIILEDDCLAEPSFFHYCEELLGRYRDDERVMAISGDNFQDGRQRTADSYYFSRFAHVWGWASWRRAWRHYDVDMKLWPRVRDGGWLRDVFSKSAAAYWSRVLQSTFDGAIDTWDYQWSFAAWINSALTVLPNVNLVSNIGFGPDATHTAGEGRSPIFATAPMVFPLRHPAFVIRDSAADDYSQRQVFSPSFRTRVWRKIANAWL